MLDDKSPKVPSDFELAQERRARALKAIADAFTLEEPDTLLSLSPVFARHLAEDEIALLAWSLFNALPWEIGRSVVEQIIAPVGPLPEDSEYLFAADLWSKSASVRELKAYGLKAYQQMPPRERQAFARYVNKGRS